MRLSDWFWDFIARTKEDLTDRLCTGLKSFLDQPEGDPRPRRRWVQPGKRRTVPYLGDHIRQNVIGVWHPRVVRFSA